MRFVPLASSSAGNAYLVEAPGGVLLIECGITYKKLQRLAGPALRGVCGCLISHEHGDHSKCWPDLIKSGIRVWASDKTVAELEYSRANAFLGILPQDPEGKYLPFRVGPFDVLPFETFHDAAQPVGFLIRCGGEKLAFATDTVRIHSRFPGAGILALEANYDKDILARCERMPEKVKKRVTNSHMEIGALCEYLEGADLSRCREIYLLHLSDASANEGGFVRRVKQVVPPGVQVIACRK